ncbi:MAG: hypothetical protein ABWX90_03085 [Candidatus Saccharimonadales bacterium]
MSESQPKDESEYVTLSPVMRYYNDINLATMSEDLIVTSLDNLIDNVPAEKTTMFQAIRESAYMPFDWEIEYDRIIAKEKLALLPLYVVGPELENSNCDLDDLKEWYRDSLRGIRMVTRDIHTNDCLSKHTAPTHEMCDFSTTCPLRSMKYFLLQAAKTPDFSKDIYKTAPKREFTIVKDKLALAMSQSIINFDMHEILMDRYSTQYNAYMSKRSLSKSDRTA